MNSLVEITPTYVMYHMDRNISCSDFTVGRFRESSFFQELNTEYGLAVL